MAHRPNRTILTLESCFKIYHRIYDLLRDKKIQTITQGLTRFGLKYNDWQTIRRRIKNNLNIRKIKHNLFECWDCDSITRYMILSPDAGFYCEKCIKKFIIVEKGLKND